MPSPEIITKDYLIDSQDPEIKLHVREKRLKGKRKFTNSETLLMCHGRIGAGPIAFDLPVPGYSWMDYHAGKGMNVFTLSVRGFGFSSRPKEFLEDPLKNPPVVRGKEAIKDIASVVNFILKKKKIRKISLLGRSWGTTLSAAFAASNPSKVHKLVLYAPYYSYHNSKRAASFENPKIPGKWDERKGAWSWCTEKDLKRRWWGHIRGNKHFQWRDKKIVEKYFEEMFKTETEQHPKNIPAVRISNGSLLDAYDRVLNKPLYNASKVTCPVLLIYGDYDGAANHEEAWGLFQKLKNSKGREYIVFSEGTHYMELEHRRGEFLSTIHNFLNSS
tara:strand:+ start:5587 stop:6579 length:993 start_codon:yes stop_codon:yes gene_type:complete